MNIRPEQPSDCRAVENLVPVSSVIGAVFLGEHVGWRQILGVVLCLCGIALLTSGRG